ncbi:retrotransposable element Tf2 [Tanacetum coccineum]
MMNTRSNDGGNGTPPTRLLQNDLNGTLTAIQRSIEQISSRCHGLSASVRLVSMHIFDKALNWHKQFIRKYGEEVDWNVYEREVQKRFDPVFEDPMVDLKNLKQVTTVQFYQEQFEALLNKVDLSEAYAVSLFIGGLKAEISILCLGTNAGQLFSLEIYADVSNSEVCELEELLEEPVMHNFQETMVDTPVISLHALTGESTYKTIRVKAYVGKHTVHVLIDSGSTHNFLDLRVAKKLGCKLKATCSMDVSVANRQIMNGSYECKGFKWTLQGVEFTSDVLILPLGGCEMVLGVQCYWSPIKKSLLPLPHLHQKGNKTIIIPLLRNTPPINIRPYKYPPSQKDVVEAMGKELMESGDSDYRQRVRGGNDGKTYVRRDARRFTRYARGCAAYLRMRRYHQDKWRAGWKMTNLRVDGSCEQRWRTSTMNYDWWRRLESEASDGSSIILWDYICRWLCKGGDEWPNVFIRLRIGAVLKQRGHPIAYLSKSLSPKHQALSTYEKEFYAVLMALEKLTTPFQAKWLPKLMGYDYEISYKKGSENTAADALLRISNGSELCSLILSSVTSDLLQQIKNSWEGDVDLQLLITQMTDHTYTGTNSQKKQFRFAALSRFLQPSTFHLKSGMTFNGFLIGSALLLSKEEQVLFVMVDRLSKYAHFIPMSHPFTAKQVAQTFMDNIYKLHDEKPKEWVQWVSLAEYWYNTNYHSSAHITPFEIVYGQPPNLHLPYIAGTSAIKEVDRTMQAREQAIAMLQFHLKRSQDRIKSMADKKRSDKSFEVGMKVYLKFQSYRQITARQGIHHKFATKFYGHVLIIAKVGKVAYKLDLPVDSQIHPVFHVSQLKLCKGTNHQVGVLPHCGPDRVLSMEPEAIIGRRLGKLNNKVVLYVLVNWINQTEEDATWELYTDLIKRFPQMELHP